MSLSWYSTLQQLVNLYSLIERIGYKYSVVIVNEDTCGQPELPRSVPLTSDSHEYLSPAAEYLDILKLFVSNVYVAETVGSQATGMGEISRAITMLSNRPQKLALRTKYLNSVIELYLPTSVWES